MFLFIVWCVVRGVRVYGLLFVVCCALFDVCWLSFAVRCVLYVVCCDICCSLVVVRCLLLVALCALFCGFLRNVYRSLCIVC